jgi:enediyne biosynthesis protein E4
VTIWKCLAVLGIGWAAGAAEPFTVVNASIPSVLKNSATPEKHQIETMPGGVAVFDYDGDGRPDIFLVNCARQPDLKKPDPSWWNRLYRNLGNWRFEDVTEKARLHGEGYGMGAATGDFDNDGRVDLLVTGVGFNTLYRNRGDGTFEDVTRKAGIPSTGWAVSAGWFDYDNDGYLDLLIVNYCVWKPADEPFCGDAKAGFRTYCHPKYYQGMSNNLFHNNRDGTFTDISQSAGITGKIGKGMGLAFADFNRDGLLDAFVGNDTEPNFLFRNDGKGKFTEVGFDAGVAYTDEGKAVSSMGVDFKDVDNDGLPDIFVTALANETYPLFRNLGKGLFQDITNRSRIATASLPNSGWSAGFYDFDLDGWKDIFSANGDVQDNTEVYSNRLSKQRNQIFLNRANGTFESVSFGTAALHRGAAFADFDGDGRLDAVVTRLNETPVLYRNTMGTGRHWLGLALRGTKSNRDAIGAHVKVTAGGLTQYWHVSTSVGYLCSSEKTIYLGLGAATTADRVEIAWPSGRKQTLTGVKGDRVVPVVEE